MRRNVSQILDQLGERTGRARERSRENIEATKRLAREINDTRAAVQSSNTQELELAAVEKTALNDETRVQILDTNGQVMDIPCLNLGHGRLTH